MNLDPTFSSRITEIVMFLKLIFVLLNLTFFLSKMFKTRPRSKIWIHDFWGDLDFSKCHGSGWIHNRRVPATLLQIAQQPAVQIYVMRDFAQ